MLILMDDIKIGKTKHKLKVLQVNRPKNPKLIYAHIEVGIGSDIETKDELELCHFLEHLFVSLTSNKYPDSIKNREIMAKHNISYSANSGSKNTSYEYSFEKKHFDIFLSMLINTLISFKVDKNIFKKEQASIVEELTELIESPEYEIETKLNDVMFKGHIRSTSEKDKLKFVKTITPKQVQTFWNKYYILDNIVISFYGNIKLESIINKINKLLQKNNTSTSTFTSLKKNYLLQSAVNNTNTNTNIHVAYNNNGSGDNCLLNMSWKLDMDVFNNDFYSLFAIDFFLFNDLTSLIMKRLRTELGIIYDIESSFSLDEFQPKLSYYTFQTSCASSNLIIVIKEILKVLNNICNFKITKNKMKEYFDAQNLQILNNNENIDYKAILENYSKQLLWKNKVELFSKEEKKYLKVTSDKIKFLSTRIFQNNNLFISYSAGKNMNKKISNLLN